MPGPLRLLLIAVAATALVVGTGTALASPDAPGRAARPAGPLRLGDLDTRTLTVGRGDFCAAVPSAAVTAALDVTVPSSTPSSTPTAPAVVAYGNGERAALTDSLTDVAHEYGCSWSSSDGVRARAWVFAPPVTRADATAMARAQRADPACASIAQAPGFGRSSVAQTCRTGGAVLASYRGLFGDAWLTCTLSLPAASVSSTDELAARVDAWCAAVVRTAAAGEPR